MSDAEAKQARDRADQFEKLSKVRDQIFQTLKLLTEPWTDGPCGQGPFTGNFRESRCVRSMQITFTATRGGAPPVEMLLPDIFVSAPALATCLQQLLRDKLAVIQKAMDEI